MVNHPNRGAASFRFVAFFMITGEPQAHASTAKEAVALASTQLPDTDFIEVLDCGDNGKKVWTGGSIPANPVPLYKARRLHATVFRGPGYAEQFPAVPMAEG
jgi:hypothetical protein